MHTTVWITWVFRSVPHHWHGGRLYLWRYRMGCRTPIYPLTVTGSVFSDAGRGAMSFMQKSLSRLWLLRPAHVQPGQTSPARSSPKCPDKDESEFEMCLPTPAGVLCCAGCLATIFSCCSAGTCRPGKGFAWIEAKPLCAGIQLDLRAGMQVLGMARRGCAGSIL